MTVAGREPARPITDMALRRFERIMDAISDRFEVTEARRHPHSLKTSNSHKV